MWKCVFPFSSSHMYRMQLLQPQRILLSNWKRNYIYTKLHYYTHTHAHTLTLSAILSFVAQRTNTYALCARAMTATLGVDALTDGNIAFRTLPSAIADTRSLVILTVSTAEDRARRLGRNRKRTRHNFIWIVSLFVFFCNALPLKTLEERQMRQHRKRDFQYIY